MSRAFCLAPQVDYVSGVGWHAALDSHAIFDFDRQQGRARLLSIHPGVSAEEVRHSTGFAVQTDEVPVTPWPTAEELDILRRVVNPHGALIPPPDDI